MPILTATQPAQKFAFALQPGPRNSDVTLQASAVIPAGSYAASTLVEPLPPALKACMPRQAVPAPGAPEVVIRATASTTVDVTLGAIARGLPPLQAVRVGLGARLWQGLVALWAVLVGFARAFVGRPAAAASPVPAASPAVPVDRARRLQGASIALSRPLQGRLSSLPTWIGHQRIRGITVDAYGKVTLRGGLRLFNVVPLPGLQSAWMPSRLRLKMPIVDMRIAGLLEGPGALIRGASQHKIAINMAALGLPSQMHVALEATDYQLSLDATGVHGRLQQDVGIDLAAGGKARLRLKVDHQHEGELPAPGDEAEDYAVWGQVRVARLLDTGVEADMAGLKIAATSCDNRQLLRVDYTTTPEGSRSLTATAADLFGGAAAAQATGNASLVADLLALTPSFGFTIKLNPTAEDLARPRLSAAERLAAMMDVPGLDSGPSSGASSPGLRTPASASQVNLGEQIVAEK